MLIRTAVAAPVIDFARDLNRLFAESTAEGRVAHWAPAVDVKENGEQFLFAVELPGVLQDKVDVSVDRGVLSISGEKALDRNETSEERFRVVERAYGTFRRTFQLPANVETSAIDATFAHGVLTVRVPKKPKPAATKIEVRSV